MASLDNCLTSLFTGIWICNVCGREFCGQCHHELLYGPPQSTQDRFARRTDHLDLVVSARYRLSRCSRGIVHSFQPSTYFKLNEIKHLLEGMSAFQASPPLSLLAQGSYVAADTPGLPVQDINEDTAGIRCHEYRTFDRTCLSWDTFRSIWAKGEVIVITNLGECFDQKWTPDKMVYEYGDWTCDVVDCDSGQTLQTDARWFFGQFGHYTDRPISYKIEVSIRCFQTKPRDAETSVIIERPSRRCLFNLVPGDVPRFHPRPSIFRFCLPRQCRQHRSKLPRQRRNQCARSWTKVEQCIRIV